jgi:2-keto-3-deoxy-L-fuconate dehydrogenase
MFRLDKKIAFVTGAGSGIGESIARLFAQQGAHVVLADLREDAAQRVAGEIHEAGGSARVQLLDVTEESQVTAGIERAAALEGRLDILVNNAGISHVGSILETSLEDWERLMQVNARGVFLCAREGVRQMLALYLASDEATFVTGSALVIDGGWTAK